MITYYLHVQIRCLIGHARQSNKMFEINEPKCERGKILLILALLYTGRFQKTKISNWKTCKKFWKQQADLKWRDLAKKCMEHIAVGPMMELSAFNLRASKEEEVYCLHQKINKSIYMSDSLRTRKGCIEKICSENFNPKCLICGKGINNFNNVYF